MGASGSGKTTLLNMIATIDTPSCGHIYIDETDIAALSDQELAAFRNEQIGFVFQDYNLLDTLTLYENISLALIMKKIPPQTIHVEVEAVALSLGIEGLLSKYPYEISCGQRQRCACARAMIKHPKLILADEPTGALDSKSAKVLMETLQTMNAEFQSTILMVTHDAVSASYCQKILFLRDGNIYHQVRKREKTPVICFYAGCVYGRF